MPNAANTAEVVRRLAAAARRASRSPTSTRRTACSPCRGRASTRCSTRSGCRPSHDYMAFAEAPYGRDAVRVCRTGYTGEHGYELIAATGTRRRAVGRAGRRPARRRRPAARGLGARDTLRTEMGYPLHGQDLVADDHARCRPGSAGRSAGRSRRSGAASALLAERAAGPPRLLRGLEALEPRHPARRTCPCSAPTATPVGEVTSGHVLADAAQGHRAGAARPRRVAEGDEVTVDVRGRGEGFVVTRPPFVPSAVRES